jgi:hypothetical protein
MVGRNELQKLIKLTGERAEFDARANESFFVYFGHQIPNLVKTMGAHNND